MSKNNNLYFAEILQSNIATFQAQSWQWDAIPEFGSLVTVTSNNRIIFGIIYAITTGPNDSIRQPIAYQKTEEELRHDQPQIFEFLKTSFSCIAVGYQENDHIFYQLPPQPGKIHTFVRYATTQEYEAYFASEQFLHLLYTTTENIKHEELLLAIIQHQLKHNTLTKKRFNKFIETFFMLYKNNYVQTKMFLQRAEQLLDRTAAWHKLAD
jgi:hypothetical protein